MYLVRRLAPIAIQWLKNGSVYAREDIFRNLMTLLDEYRSTRLNDLGGVCVRVVALSCEAKSGGVDEWLDMQHAIGRRCCIRPNRVER